MSNLDQIQRLCEEYVGRKFGKRDKNDLLNFLRGLQGQRVGDSDDEQEQGQVRYADTRTSQPRAVPVTVETPAVVKEGAPIAKKATAFIGTVTEAYQSKEPRTPVKTSDFDDVEGVKNRHKKWEEGQVAGSEGIRAAPEGYKLDSSEDHKARKDKWEQGQTIGAAGIKPAAEGYKLDSTEDHKARKDKWEQGQTIKAAGTSTFQPEGYKLDSTEDHKARKDKWEQGQTIGAEGIKQPVEGYKLDSTEELKARKDKWEQGQTIKAAGTATFQPEGYKLGESAGVKDRLNKWSEVASNVPIARVDRTADLETDNNAKERRKQWEEGNVGQKEAGSSKSPVKVAEDDAQVDAVKERLNKWSEVTKDPEPAAARKEPLKIYDDEQ